MTFRIFGENAARYWAAGLPVIPLKPMEKAPVPHGWSLYCDQMPTAEEQKAWLDEYPHCNMGLPLGRASGLLMIDIDTDDEALKKAILDVLSPFPSPWIRIGMKGMALAYRQPIGVQEPLKTFRLKRSDTKKTIVEVLSRGAQLVLPPSIHPDTKRPYVANVDLVECMSQIPHIPADIESLLRGCLEDQGISLSLSGTTGVTEFVSVGNRDNQMTRMAGICAMAVTRGELTVIEAVGRMNTWYEMCVEKIAGDPLDIHKGIESMCGFLVRDVMHGKRTLPKGWDSGLTPEMKKGMGLDFDHEHEEWTYDEIITFIKTKLEQHGGASTAWIEAISYILERLARSKSIDSLGVEKILSYIAQVGEGLTVAILRNRMKEMKQGGIKGQDHTEIANKVIEEMQQYGEMRYHNSRFWQWAGSHWEEAEEDQVIRVIANEFGNLAAAKKRGDHVGILKTMASLINKPLRTVEQPGINFANGYLTHELKMMPHDREYGCTYTLPYRHDAELADKAEMFQKFLDRCWIGDEDRQLKKMLLQEAIAVTLFGLGPAYSRVLLLIGLANTGKSELLRVVDSLLPDSVKSALPPDQWKDRFGPAQLAGKLLNIAGELSSEKKIDGQTFKQVVSGEVLTGQFKGMQLFTFRPMATHWFASNHTPKTDDTSEGFNRRWALLRFDHPITKEERIPNIARQLVVQEREAIVAWALEGIKRIAVERDYTLPPSHHQWLDEIANNNNSVRYFMKESGLVRVTTAPEGGAEKTSPHISETKLFDAYSSFCIVTGAAQRAGLRQFKMRMLELAGALGFRIKTIHHAGGMNETIYTNLTFVDAKAA